MKPFERSPVICDLITTIIPVFNRPALLQEAVASVLAQDYRPIEIIIVNDGSTDATGQVAEALATENPGVIRVLLIANGGPGVGAGSWPAVGARRVRAVPG